MFHHAHAYIASKLYKSQNDLLLFGSVLPDIAITGIIEWRGKVLHGGEANISFSKFIAKNYSAYMDLAKGVNDHNILDSYSHDNYKGSTGYAYQNTEELALLTSRYYGVDKKRAKGIAHNYIECAVDILLLKDQPSIQNLVKKSFQSVDNKALTKLLSEYFNKEPDEFLRAFSQFTKLMGGFDFTQEGNWLLFWQELDRLFSLKNLENQVRKILFNTAIGIVKNSYEAFLENALISSFRKI